MLEYNIAYGRSVALLCILYKIKCNLCCIYDVFSCHINTCAVCAIEGYIVLYGVETRASSLLDIEVPQDFYSSRRISVERS